jgi:outer membrane protein
MNKFFIGLVMLTISSVISAKDILSLDSCKRMAVKNNLSVKQADNQVVSSQEAMTQAYTSFFPTAKATGMYYKPSSPLFDFEYGGERIIDGKYGYSAGVEVSLPIYSGGQLTTSYKLSKVGVEVSLLERQKLLRDVDIQVEEYFWQIVMLQEKIKTVDSADTLLTDLHKTVENAVKNGLKNRNDLLKVELRIDENESYRLQLENRLKVSKQLLAQYIGRSDADFDVTSEINVSNLHNDLLSIRQNHDMAVGHIAEYRLLQKNVDAGKLEVDMERGKYLPTIGIGAGYEYEKFFGKAGGGAAFYATVSIPISDWWGGSHAMKSKEKKLENAQYELENSKQKLLIQVDNLWYEVEEAYKILSIAQKSIIQAEENLRINRNTYRFGATTMTELLDAELLCRQVHDNFSEAYSKLHTKIIEYQLMIRN